MAAIREGWDVSIPKAVGNAMVDVARNDAIAKVRPDTDYVLFCDDDMAPEPDSLTRLLAHGVPVVSALCTTRSFPVRLAAAAYVRETDRFCKLRRGGPEFQGQLVSGDYVAGAAFLLVQKGTLDQVVEYYLSAKDWIDNHRTLLDRLHVRAELREAERKRVEQIRREAYAEKQTPGVFAFQLQDNQAVMGEDFYFCRSFLRLGIPVGIDTACVVGHIGEFCYSARLLDVEDWKDVRVPA